MAASKRRSRRHSPTETKSSAVAQANGSWPSSGTSIIAGLSNSSAIGSGLRSSGNDQSTAAKNATAPSTSHNVTAQSPNNGNSIAEVTQGRKEYGNASASPWPSTGM